MDLEKVSVIIPIYNAEKYLHYTLKSLIQQTYKNLEIILINDGSTDLSLNICKKFKNQYSNIILYNKSNEGVDYARHDGIRLASGEYIIFCDADDWYEKDGIQYLVNIIKQKNCDIVVGNVKRVFSAKFNIKKQYNRKTELENRIIRGSEKEKYKISFFRNGAYPISLWGKIFRKTLFKSPLIKTGLKFGEDAFLHLQLYERATEIFISEKYVYNYRIGGITSKVPINIMESCIQGYLIRKDYCIIHNYEVGIIESLKDLFFCFRGFILSLPNYNKNKNEVSKILNIEFSRPEYDEFKQLKKFSGCYNDELSNLIYNKNILGIIKFSFNLDRRTKNYLRFLGYHLENLLLKFLN